MSQISHIFNENLDVIFFLYGTAFLLMGVTILLQPRRGSIYKLASILWTLAAFGLLHGVNEYMDMWAIIKGRSEVFDLFRCFILVVSYLFLFEFGRLLVELCADIYPGPIKKALKGNHWQLAPLLMLIVFGLGFLSKDIWTSTAIWARYLICFPGAIISGIGLLLYCRYEKKTIDQMRIKKYFLAAAYALMSYGVLGGLIVPKGDILLSGWINTESFSAVFGLPVQVMRAVVAVIATWGAYGILKIFNWEATDRLESEIIERKKIEAELRNYSDRLEDLVEERASEILKVNETLEAQICERRLIEVELEKLIRDKDKSAKEWQQTFDAAHDIICLISPTHEVLRMNETGYKALGRDPEDVIGKPCYEIVHGLTKPLDGCPCSKALQNKEPASSEVDEHGRSYIVSASPIFDDERNVVAFVHMVTDITERKKAERELKASLDAVKKTLSSTIGIIAVTVEARDPYTAGHQKRVATLACAIAQEMGLSSDKIEGIRMAGIIHDIGKIWVPAEILAKPGQISDMEMTLVRQHPVVGADILKTIDFPWPIDKIVLQHHERMDGSGYPAGLYGDQIIIEARILAVADVVEAMASHRPYRPALGIEAALHEVNKNKGLLFDTQVVEACKRVLKNTDFDFNSDPEIALETIA